MHILIFSRLFSQAIINIQDLTTVTTIPSFCWREKENQQCGLPSWKSQKKSSPTRYCPEHGRKTCLIPVWLWGISAQQGTPLRPPSAFTPDPQQTCGRARMEHRELLACPQVPSYGWAPPAGIHPPPSRTPSQKNLFPPLSLLAQTCTQTHTRCIELGVFPAPLMAPAGGRPSRVQSAARISDRAVRPAPRMQTSPTTLLALAYLLGPRRLLAGIYPFFVMVEGFLLCRPLVLPLLLLLLLQGDQVVPLLLELPLEPLRLPLLLQLLALVLLPRRKRSHASARPARKRRAATRRFVCLGGKWGPSIESQNHSMVRVGRDLKDHLLPTPLPWAGTSSTRPGCSELHPT